MKYRVKKTFPSKEVLTRGQIVENPKWRNLGALVRTGYLELIEEAETKPAEVKKKKRG